MGDELSVQASVLSAGDRLLHLQDLQDFKQALQCVILQTMASSHLFQDTELAVL